MKKLQNSFYEIKIAYSPICNNSNIINTFLPTHRLYLYSVNNFKLNYCGAELTSLLAFSNISFGVFALCGFACTVI